MIKLRDATKDDVATMTEVAHEAKSGWGYPAEWIAAWKNELTVTADDLERHHFRADTELNGFIGLARHEDAVEILHLWVRPGVQGSGIGRILFDDALRFARESGRSRLFLDSDPNAVGFYDKMGCRVVGATRADVCGTPRSLPRMERLVDGYTLDVLPKRYAISRLDPDAPVPGGDWFNVTRTDEELSLIAEEGAQSVSPCEPGWRALKLRGPFPFDMTGVLASVLDPLRDAGIGILALSTYDTDYVFVKDDQLAQAVESLRVAGLTVEFGLAGE